MRGIAKRRPTRSRIFGSCCICARGSVRMSSHDLGTVVLIHYRVLLDDVLAAVDSQVARQVFGKVACLPSPTEIADTVNSQIKLLGHVVCLQLRQGLWSHTASHSSRSLISWSSYAAESSSSQGRMPILWETKEAMYIS
jgi:hypothetical protein